jgi:hypothetical protein
MFALLDLFSTADYSAPSIGLKLLKVGVTAALLTLFGSNNRGQLTNKNGDFQVAIFCC